MNISNQTEKLNAKISFLLNSCRLFLSADNPISIEEGYRIEILSILRNLERLDKDIYQEDERQDAQEVMTHFVLIHSFSMVIFMDSVSTFFYFIHGFSFNFFLFF